MSRAGVAGLLLVAAVTLHAPATHADPPAEKAAPEKAPEQPASGKPMTLDALFEALGKSPGLEAKFREEKKIALLFAPLRSEGIVHFDRAKGLARHTLTPSKQSVLLSGGTLSVWDGTKTEKIELKKTPELRAFADGFSMLLAADRPGLERSFKLELAQDPAGQGQWRLRLLPVAKEVRAIVSEIEVVGRGIVVRTLRVLEASGDESTTTFSDVDTQKRYDTTTTVFRVPPGAAP